MTEDDLNFIAQVVRRESGVILPPQKTDFFATQLGPVARRFGFSDADGLIAELRRGHETFGRAVAEALTTTASSFFRDPTVFEHFRDLILPRLIENRAKTRCLRIWCAACAAGQEPYSIAMLLDDANLVAQGWTVDLIATDLSAEMIARSEAGLYSDAEVQGLASDRLAAHFTQDGENWRIHENLRRMVAFRQFNLLNSFEWLGDLHAVFCRNVMIYFGDKTKTELLDKIAGILAPDGALILGQSESVHGVSDVFVPHDRAPMMFVKTVARTGSHP